MNAWNPDRNTAGQFQPGSGGRPRGARNRTGRKIREAWEKSADENVDSAIDTVLKQSPATYLRLMMKAVPTPAVDEVRPEDMMTEEEVEQSLREYCAKLIFHGYGPQQGELSLGDRRTVSIYPQAKSPSQSPNRHPGEGRGPD